MLTVPVDTGDIAIDDPESTLAVFSRKAALAKNPIASAFLGYRFLAEHAAFVRPGQPAPGGPANFRAETLIENSPESRSGPRPISPRRPAN